MHRDGSIERLDEFVTDLFESGRNILCQFPTYYARVILIIWVQRVHRKFDLEELTRML